ncbi:MAG: hypothetical protein JNM36_08035 [Chitinophagales bacterium]|jgi:hypothetical protein|nr:hypothetical protein [Chitinophagales bacterium]HNI44052.1 DUF5777 family beta-barrel protein [Chitinophagales bacterium]HNL06505.1 DUF5777 family beta-barrel protein [Chitinophagales bacterium]
MNPKNYLLSIIILALLLCFPNLAQAQDDDVDDLLEKETEYAVASFKTTRVVNAHSLENTYNGVLDFRISHRFGFLNGGFYDMFGLDNATMRLNFDYGINDWLMVGVARSNYEKTYDGFVKVKMLRQSTGKRKMPFTLAYVGGMAIKTVKFADQSRENFFSSRLYYSHQLLIGRKFSEGFSLQFMPTLVHRNLTLSPEDKNDVFSLGVAGRIKLSRRVALNAEYFYVFPNQVVGMGDTYHNSLSLGFDIETGGHVFQLHFTNSTSMLEKGFINETTGNWLDGDIHFGFNVSRVFTLRNPVKK